MIPTAVECAFKNTGHCSTCAKSAQAGGVHCLVWVLCEDLYAFNPNQIKLKHTTYIITCGVGCEQLQVEATVRSNSRSACPRLTARNGLAFRRVARAHSVSFAPILNFQDAETHGSCINLSFQVNLLGCAKKNFHLCWCAARAHSVTFVPREVLSGPSQFLSRPPNFFSSPPFHLEHPILPCARFTPGRPLGPQQKL